MSQTPVQSEALGALRVQIDSIDKQLLCLLNQRRRRQRLISDAAWRDENGFGQFEAAVVEPQGGHEVQRHVGFEDRPVATADRQGALAPVRRVGQADRIAGARILVEAALLQRAEEGLRHLPAGGAGPAHGESRLGRLRHGTIFRVSKAEYDKVLSIE